MKRITVNVPKKRKTERLELLKLGWQQKGMGDAFVSPLLTPREAQLVVNRFGVIDLHGQIEEVPDELPKNDMAETENKKGAKR